MVSSCYALQVATLIASVPNNRQILRAAMSLDLPDWLIAAGFVRNQVWDYLFDTSTPLADIDVIYFCRRNISEERDRKLERRLRRLMPALPWSVKNQARMHLGNGDSPYCHTLDAMSFWPEKQTSVGVRIDSREQVEIRHSFDLAFLFDGKISYNNKRDIETFKNRIQQKKWLKCWPKLQIEY